MKKKTVNKLFDDNRFLVIFSIISAVLLYIIVAMTNNDNRTKIIHNVPVSLDSQAAILTNQRLSIIEGGQSHVDVEVNGPLTEIGHLDADSPELATTAKVGNITTKGTYALQVVSDYSGSLPFKIVGYSPSTIDVRFDVLTTKSFTITPVVKGVSTPPPYVFDGNYVGPDKVNITGPETELERIASCEVSLELDKPLEQTHAQIRPIILRDIQGEVINPVDHHLTLSETETQLVISVLKETELPLEVGFLNEPRGFPTDELRNQMELSNESLVVAGRADDVDKLTEIVVGHIDIKNLRINDNAKTFPLELPDTLQTRENLSSVSVKFDTASWDIASFNVSDVQMISAPYDYDVTILSTRIDNVEFVGMEGLLETMTADDIVAEINLSEQTLTPGQRNYPVKISAPGKGLVWAVGDYNVVIQVSEKKTAT